MGKSVKLCNKLLIFFLKQDWSTEPVVWSLPEEQLHWQHGPPCCFLRWWDPSNISLSPSCHRNTTQITKGIVFWHVVRLSDHIHLKQSPGKQLQKKKKTTVCIAKKGKSLELQEVWEQGSMETSEPVSASGDESCWTAGRALLSCREKGPERWLCWRSGVNCCDHPSSVLTVSCQLGRSCY